MRDRPTSRHRRTVSRLALALVLAAVAACEPGGGSAPAADAATGADPGRACEGVDCPAHATCDPATGTCTCDAGYEPLGAHCVAVADTVADAAGDGADLGRTDAGTLDGQAPKPDASPPDAPSPDVADAAAGGDAGEDAAPDAAEDAGPSLPLCPVPQAPVLPILHVGATLRFTLDPPGAVEVGLGDGADAPDPVAWAAADTVVLDTPGFVTVFARAPRADCRETRFVATYEVRERYPSGADAEGSTAVPRDDPAIGGWATGVAAVRFGADVDVSWQTPDEALGPAEGTSTDIVCLGRGGTITLTFEAPISDRDGADLAVFENSFLDTFLELAFVEVSSDGEHFVRFDSVSLGEAPVAAFGTVDPATFGGLAGTYRQGFGTPFDLESLANRPDVLEGRLDLDAVTHVRIVDIPGDGSVLDSFGGPIYDPYPTTESAGFDLDAVAVLRP